MIKDDISSLKQSIEKKLYKIPEHISAQDKMREKKHFQLDLLKETLNYAYANVHYYRAEWDRKGLSPINLRSLEDFRHWPILTKADVFNHRNQLLSKSCSVIGYRCTTGTTGSRLPLPISREEVQAINDFSQLKGLVSGREVRSPIVLQVAPPVRRIAANTGGSGNGPVITTYLNLDAADHRFEFDYVDHIMQCLLEYYPSNSGNNYVEVLWTCPTFMVRTLTYVLMQRNFDVKSCHVKNIVCSGGTITKALCDYVRDFWGAPLSGFYSMTEVAGSHRRKACTGEYEFDAMAFVEFVDPFTYEPVEDGQDGVLLLTSLYPFQQAQPMIRYWTGDVFTVSNHGQSGLFRGRLFECLDLWAILPERTHPRMLGSADVLEVLHAIPELPQNHKNPKFFLSADLGADRPIKLTVESFPQGEKQRRKLTRYIAKKLSERIKLAGGAFGASLNADLLDVKIVDKGSVRGSVSAYYPDR